MASSMFIKKSSLRFLCLSAFAFAASAQAAPQDLEKVMQNWHKTVKTPDSTQVLQLEMQMLPSDSADMNMQLINHELASQSASLGGDVDLMQFNILKDESRAAMMKAIFPAGNMNLAFCKAFPTKPYKAKAGSTLTAEQLQVEQQKADYRACKSTMNDVLGGVIHGNPLTYEIGTVLASNNDGSAPASISFYITSIIDPSQAVRISLQL